MSLQVASLYGEIKKKTLPLISELNIFANEDQSIVAIQCFLKENVKNSQNFIFLIRPNGRIKGNVILSDVYISQRLKELGLRFTPHTCKNKEIAAKIIQFIRDAHYLLLYST